MTQNPSLPPRPSPFWGILTLVVAIAWLLGGELLAHYVLHYNATRAVAALMTGQLRPSESKPISPMESIAPGLFPGMNPPPPSTQSSQPAEPTSPGIDPAVLQRQLAAADVIAMIWRKSMRVVAGLLAGVGALSLYRPGWSRPLHLMAACVILLASAATLAALRLLIHPTYGGLDPLSVWTHIGLAAVSSLYGWVLLIAFARRRHPQGSPVDANVV